MISTKRILALAIVLARITKNVPPTADLEVGLLSIHETNSMIHPGIEGIGITVAGRGGPLLQMMKSSKNVANRQKVLCPLQGMYFSEIVKFSNIILLPGADDFHPLTMRAKIITQMSLKRTTQKLAQYLCLNLPLG